MISTSTTHRVVKPTAGTTQSVVIKAGSRSPQGSLQSCKQILRCTVATPEAAAVPDLSKKRKAESCAADTAEPETKRGKTLYETTIAAPFRRARRSLGCMHKVFQPIWSRTIAQPESSSHHQKTDAIDGTALPSASSASLATVAAPAQTPQKGHLLRAASPLLEEMLDSPVTTSKPTQEAAAGSPERHALYQDMLHSSSSHQQGLLPRLSCGISPNDRNAAGCRPGLSAVGDAANTDRRRQGPFQFPDKQAESSGSMSSSAIGGPAVTTAIGADASLDGSRCGHNAQANAAAVTNSASHHIGAVAEDPACCCSDTNACASTARISSECSPTHSQAMTGGKLAVKSNGRYQGAGVELTAHQDIAQQHPGNEIGLHLKKADTPGGASHVQPISAVVLLQTPSSRRVSFTLPEGAKWEDTERTPGKGFMRSPIRTSPGKPHAFRYSPGKAGTPRLRSDLSHGMQSYSCSPLSRHTHTVAPQHRSTPTRCCSSFGGQQPKRVADVRVQNTEQQRGVEDRMDIGGKRLITEEGCMRAAQQEKGVAYVDIPRRVAWERITSPGGKRHALQAASSQIDPLQQDCREAFLNEKLAFTWKAGQAWAQLDLAGIQFTQDTCSQHHAKWKAAAERFIEKRGYMAAERLRATLQSEWQQLKAIRQRCCSTVPKVNDVAGHINLLPRTPKSIMKRKSLFIPRSQGAVMLTSGPT